MQLKRNIRIKSPKIYQNPLNLIFDEVKYNTRKKWINDKNLSLNLTHYPYPLLVLKYLKSLIFLLKSNI